MKAHIARNQNAGIPLALGWNLSAADRGILEGMAPAFGMKLLQDRIGLSMDECIAIGRDNPRALIGA